MTFQQPVVGSAAPDRGASAAADIAPGGSVTGRLVSIDALRGFDMFWIIGGAAVFGALADVWPNPLTFALKRQLEHVPWEGCHFYDLIYPLFLFLIGAVLPFSLSRRRTQGGSLGRLYLHFLKRSVVLIILGSIPGGVLNFNKWPYLGGVLAHIGLCYLPAAILVRHGGWRTRAGIIGGWLVCYWLICVLIPVPGFGAAVFTKEGSLPSYIDHHFISGNLWNEGPASIPSGIVIILCGSLAGEWLRSKRSGNHKARGLALAGVAGVVLGLVWSFSFPVIKRVVWSSSYVSLACGWSLLLLALFYWVIDVKGYRRWAFFFVVIGMNAITIYFLQTIVNFKDIGKLFFGGIDHYSGIFHPVVLPLGVLALKWWVLLFLYQRKAFFKL